MSAERTVSADAAVELLAGVGAALVKSWPHIQDDIAVCNAADRLATVLLRLGRGETVAAEVMMRELHRIKNGTAGR